MCILHVHCMQCISNILFEENFIPIKLSVIKWIVSELVVKKLNLLRGSQNRERETSAVATPLRGTYCWGAVQWKNKQMET